MLHNVELVNNWNKLHKEYKDKLLRPTLTDIPTRYLQYLVPFRSLRPRIQTTWARFLNLTLTLKKSIMFSVKPYQYSLPVLFQNF